MWLAFAVLSVRAADLAAWRECGAGDVDACHRVAASLTDDPWTAWRADRAEGFDALRCAIGDPACTNHAPACSRGSVDGCRAAVRDPQPLAVRAMAAARGCVLGDAAL